MGLYNNNEEGLVALEQALNKRKDQSMPTDFLIKLKRLVLTRNILEFDKDYWIQLIGTAMGAPSAPTYANIFMAVVDIWLEECGVDERTLESLIAFIKRFIDDYLLMV